MWLTKQRALVLPIWHFLSFFWCYFLIFLLEKHSLPSLSLQGWEGTRSAYTPGFCPSANPLFFMVTVQDWHGLNAVGVRPRTCVATSGVKGGWVLELLAAILPQERSQLGKNTNSEENPELEREQGCSPACTWLSSLSLFMLQACLSWSFCHLT